MPTKANIRIIACIVGFVPNASSTVVKHANTEIHVVGGKF